MLSEAYNTNIAKLIADPDPADEVVVLGEDDGDDGVVNEMSLSLDRSVHPLHHKPHTSDFQQETLGNNEEL